MKPTFQISRQDRRAESQRPVGLQVCKSPITDWNYQPTAPTLRARGFRREEGESSRLPSFHLLSQGYFATESRRELRLEGVLFAVIAALAAWPLMLAAQAALVLVK